MSIMIKIPTYIIREESYRPDSKEKDWIIYFQFHSEPNLLSTRISLFHALQFTKASAFDSGFSKSDVCIKSIDRHGKETIY